MGPLRVVAESPYRAAFAQSLLEAPTAIGPVSVLLAPQHIRLEIGNEVWTIGNDHLSVVIQGKRRQKKRCILLKGAHLYMAKAWPTGEVSLWIERKTGIVQRLLGLKPVIGMDHRAIDGWRQLERLSVRLQEALSPYSGGTSAFELGRGQHRVFGLCTSKNLVVYARPVFREHPRRIVEMRSNGTIRIPQRKKDDLEFTMKDGVEVIASGDRICFCQPDGLQIAGIFLPWIGAPDRCELTRRFQSLVGRVKAPSEKLKDNIRRGIGLIAPLPIG